MESTSYLQAVRRSWYLVLLGVVLGTTVGWLAFHNTTPQYVATAQLSVGYTDGAFANEIASRDQAAVRAQAFIQIIGTRPVVAAAAKEAGLGDVSATAVGNAADKSSLFTVAVTSTDQNAVAPIANAYQRILIPQLTELVGPLDANVRLVTVEPATTPRAAFTPIKSRDIGLGAAAGLLLGLLVALLREALGRAVRTPEEIAQIADLRLLGTVPEDTNRDSLPTLTSSRSARAEAYRQVRTAWFALRPRAQVIVVTSSIQGEGKTTLSTNLATSVARSGHSVVIVDADLRRPRLADVFELDPELPGLAALLAGEALLGEVIHDLGEAMPSVIAAGGMPEEPSELLELSSFAEMIEQLRARFDYVVVDTPPTLPVTDTLVVAPHADAVILVARIGTATAQRLRRTVGALERVDAVVAGVVANGATGSAALDYKRGYYYQTRPAKPRGRTSTKTAERRSDERRSGGKRSART